MFLFFYIYSENERSGNRVFQKCVVNNKFLDSYP
jgi:hypothetical protein